MIGSPLCEMTADDLLKAAVQPTSHSWPTDNRLPDARDGNRWTDFAGPDSLGKFSFGFVCGCY